MGLSDYFGRNDPGSIFENKLIPLLRSLGVKKEKDIKKVFDVVKEIGEKCYSNGSDNRESELNDY